MKLLFDFFPILLFFVAYKLFGIYVATGVAMVASIGQVSFFWLKYRRFEPLHLVTLALVLVLGGATLILHDQLFIKWKPTAIYWAFALFFLVSQLFGRKCLIQRLMDNKLTLPNKIWLRLNFSWVLFFVLMGIANLYVVYHYSTDTWVNFKLFGTLGLTLVFVILQAIYMSRHGSVDNA